MGDLCPRCGGRLNQQGEYDTCMRCGYEDYSQAPRGRMPPRDPSFRGSGILELPYKGEEFTLRHRTVSVMLPDKSRGRPIRIKTCPVEHCLYSMYAESVPGDRKIEKSFNCKGDHWIRVKVSETSEGGWW